MKVRTIRRLGALSVLAALATMTVAGGQSAAATVNPGPPQVPSLTLEVQNSCTGLPVSGLAVALNPTSGEDQPGPAAHPAPGLYTWSQAALEVGTYALDLTAPGFAPVGDPAVGTSPVTIVKAQVPGGLVAGSAVIEGETTSVMMTPIAPSRFCLHLPALPLPALVGAVVDGTGTDGGLSAATVCLTSVTGQKPPGPGCVPGPLFAFPASSFAAGAITLSVTAPGFLPLGTDTDGGFSPVTVQKPPGPGCIPGQDYCTGLDAVIGLAPAT